MADLSRYNGKAAAGTFYGYEHLIVQITGTNVGTAATGGNGAPIVEGNYDKAVRTLQNFGSIVALSAASNNEIVAMFDKTTFKQSTAGVPALTDLDAALLASTGVTTTSTAKTLLDVA